MGEHEAEAGEGSAGHDRDSVRARGIAKMEEVYGFSVDPDEIAGPYVDFTVDHLFGTIWMCRAAWPHLQKIQFRSALERGELSEEQVRETVLHLTHYIGWPLSTGVNAVAEKVIAQRQQAKREEQA